MEKVVIFGNASVACVLCVQLSHDSQYEVVGFTVDRDFIEDDTLLGLPVVPFDDVVSVYPPNQHKMMIAVGYVKVNKIRAKRYYQAKEMGYQLISYISPQATTWPGLQIGQNSKISANCLIQPFAEIGNNVIISSGSIIGHHTIIKDHCYLAGGVIVAGGVSIEPYSFLGSGAIVRNRVTIASRSVIGAGSVILEDTQERGVYMANPAELLPISSDDLPLS